MRHFKESNQWGVIEDNNYKKRICEEVDKIVPIEFDWYKRDVPLRNVEFDIYDISQSKIYNDDEEINEIIRQAFIRCMNNDEYMLFFEWNFYTFYFNPKAGKFKTEKDSDGDSVIEKYYSGGTDLQGNHVVDYPTFYAGCEYNFFIAKDMSWGYLAHPWRKWVLIYGENLMAEFKRIAKGIDFRPIKKQRAEEKRKI